MKRILLPAGGAILATGLLAAGLAGTANANPDWASDTLAKDAPAAVDVAKFWLGVNGATNNLAKATPYTWETTAAPGLKAGGGYTPDGKPGSVLPTGEGKTTTSVVKNINLPRTIGKVFFVDADSKLKWCSATSIQSKYHNLVATAGHCVYDDKKNASVMDNWVFVPAYYQGKTPYGVYVGKTAYTHYDYSVFNDRDRDYAFVTVYNGIQIGGGSAKEVKKSEYDAFSGAKFTKDTAISEAEYKKTVDLNGGESADAWAKADTIKDPVGPDYPAAVKVLQEVSKDAYDNAPTGQKNGAKAEAASGKSEFVTKAEYEAYTGPGYRKIDAKGNYTITKYFVKYWVKETQVKGYFKTTFYVVDGFIKDTGALGNAVGGQGFTWNQKTGQTVFVFGYPADAHPDGNKAYTGVTPKWCYGKTTGKVYVSAAEKVEEHVGLKCSMTPGADGAAWLVKYNNSKRLGYVNGVTSLFGDQDKNGRYDLSTSAYFDGETAAVYNQAAAVWSGSIVK
ncbi:hypothetical protein OHA77_26675 [Streptosporangium sp. NBC_01639]|uniref:hypothetical protein n=1 Tax=Streptosporangium sp. NBC_01639 TaxID=2975948 RepID=UPI00386D93D6|nr:hypothetical protein OHA77_26675 [Streptosporangium sp. NBC_01639]